jgi:hypothetical protein
VSKETRTGNPQRTTTPSSDPFGRRLLAVGLVVLVAAGGWLALWTSDPDVARRGCSGRLAGQAGASPAPSSSRASTGAVNSAKGIWISTREVARLARSGPGWSFVKRTADQPLGRADIAVQNNLHGVRTYAVALVYARTGAARYRTKARNAIMSAIGTQRGGSSLAVGRNAAAYVLAADLINLRNMSRRDDHAFRNWLTRLCTGVNAGNPRWPTLVRTSENTSSNWGAFATASRIAIDLYLGDKADLKRAARIHAAYADRSAYPRGKPWGAYFQPTADFDPGHWACDPARWVAINPPCTKGGNDLDGAFVEDISREPAQQTRLPQPADSPGVSYSWETLQAVMFQAELLRRAGYPNLWTRSDHALKRATSFIDRAGWYDRWSVTRHVAWVINERYGTHFPTQRAQYGRLVGFTDWTNRR